jgi:hypothetical protein
MHAALEGWTGKACSKSLTPSLRNDLERAGEDAATPHAATGQWHDRWGRRDSNAGYNAANKRLSCSILNSTGMQQIEKAFSMCRTARTYDVNDDCHNAAHLQMHG